MTVGGIPGGTLLVEGITAVVPVYNSQDSLAELIERLTKVLGDCAPSHEVVLVDDGSSDASWRVLEEICAARCDVRAIRLARNYGQHNALLVGVRAARHSTIVTLDDDLQDPPEEIPKLVGRLGEDADIVYGVPELEVRNVWRALATRLTKFAMKQATRERSIDDISAFRAFRTRLRDAFTLYDGPFVSLDVLLTWGTTKLAAVKVRRDVRRYGRSNYKLRTLVSHSFNMLTGFSTRPLQLVSLVGFGFSLFGVGVLAYVLVLYEVNGGSVAGFPFLASTIAIFSGVQLFSLGIIGEYLARMHFRLMTRPAYVIAAELGGVHDQ